MSLILDALKRAERERQAERSPALAEIAAPGTAAAGRRWGRWVALGVLLVVGAAIAVTVLRDRSARPVAARATPAPLRQPAAPATPPVAKPAPVPATEPAPAPIKARPAPRVLPGLEGIATLEDVAPETDLVLVPAEPVPAPAAPAPAPSAPETQQPLRREETKPASKAPAGVAAQPIPATGAEPAGEVEPAAEPEPAVEPEPDAAPREIPPALTRPAPLRSLREMPPDYRADFPALTIEVHVFEPSRRFVMVNGRRYKEGERLSEGPQLVEIVNDGIVLEYRGQRVLLPLGR